MAGNAEYDAGAANAAEPPPRDRNFDAMWQVEFPRGWCNIDVSVQETIQLAYESGSPTVVFAILQSSRHDLWRHVNSGRIRKIRLSPEDANATLALEDVKRNRSSEEKRNKMPKTDMTAASRPTPQEMSVDGVDGDDPRGVQS